MLQIIPLNLAQKAWQPHPTIAGIETKFFATHSDYIPVHDVLIAKVEAGQVIPWHVHSETCEVAYVMQGQGSILTALTEAHDPTTRHDLETGSAVIVPAGLWHSVINTGQDPLLLFALHTQ